ncbi:MAG TPA: PaaI family thioesterase [Thermoplasmata archaeon]|nr:PaaI family thioesterase [Thermoplasmata archaeon]
MPRRSRDPSPRPHAPTPDLYRAARTGFHHEVGFRVVAAESGRGVCTVTGRVERRHLNINGVVHGGVYATILDTAMGAAVVSDLAVGETTATTSLYVEFLRAAREGDTLTARGRIQRRGRHIAFVEGELTGADGQRLSQARGTWYIWSPEPSAPAGEARRRPVARRR